MRLVDTSAWIEWLMDSPSGKAFAAEMPPREACLVPTIVQLELAKWLSRERSEDEADRVIAYTQTCLVFPLDTPIALEAAAICRQHKLPTADAIIYATAMHQSADLLPATAISPACPTSFLSRRQAKEPQEEKKSGKARLPRPIRYQGCRFTGRRRAAPGAGAHPRSAGAGRRLPANQAAREEGAHERY